jgi:hypothetical protein
MYTFLHAQIKAPSWLASSATVQHNISMGASPPSHDLYPSHISENVPGPHVITCPSYQAPVRNTSIHNPSLLSSTLTTNTIYAGGCYMDSHVFLNNPHFFDETNDDTYCIVDTTFPAVSSTIDSNFILASLSYVTIWTFILIST